MILDIIADILKSDSTVNEYCNGSIYAISAPKDTACPYVVVSHKEIPIGDNVITTFDIEINIYDYNSDKRPALEISDEIKSLLSIQIFNKKNKYSDIRLFFEGREPIEESDPMLTRVFMQFTARACEEYKGNN